MKTNERKNGMNISEAKQIRIVDFLAQLGHRAQYVKSGQYWYLSPFRREETPSFKVNDRLNEWYDFGAPPAATSWNWGSTCTGRTA